MPFKKGGPDETYYRKHAVLFVALLAGAAPAQEKINISIGTGGTGGTGGVYYPMGGGMANVLSKYVPGMQATAEVTGGSVANLQLLGTGKSDVGLVMVDAALTALQGEDKFKSGKIPIRTLMVLYPNRMHVVTIASTGIKKMADLKGKRVSTGSPGSATEVMAFRVIEAAGLDKDKDLKQADEKVEQYTKEIARRKEELKEYGDFLPSATERSAVQKFVLQTIEDLNIKIVKTDEIKTQDKNYYTTLDVAVTLKGTYRDFKLLLARIHRSDRVIRVKKFDITSLDDDRHLQTVEAEFQTYFAKIGG